MADQKAQKLAGMVVDYLKGAGQLDLLPEVIKILTRKSTSLGYTNSAIVTTPVKLDAGEFKSIESYIHKVYGDGLTVIEKIDPDLIAGFTIKVGDEVIDSSLATKLENIRKELV